MKLKAGYASAVASSAFEKLKPKPACTRAWKRGNSKLLPKRGVEELEVEVLELLEYDCDDLVADGASLLPFAALDVVLVVDFLAVVVAGFFAVVVVDFLAVDVVVDFLAVVAAGFLAVEVVGFLAVVVVFAFVVVVFFVWADTPVTSVRATTNITIFRIIVFIVISLCVI